MTTAGRVAVGAAGVAALREPSGAASERSFASGSGFLATAGVGAAGLGATAGAGAGFAAAGAGFGAAIGATAGFASGAGALLAFAGAPARRVPSMTIGASQRLHLMRILRPRTLSSGTAKRAGQLVHETSISDSAPWRTLISRLLAGHRQGPNFLSRKRTRVPLVAATTNDTLRCGGRNWPVADDRAPCFCPDRT